MHTTGVPRESRNCSNSGPLLMGLSKMPSMRRSVKSRMRCISASLLCPCRAMLSEYPLRCASVLIALRVWTKIRLSMLIATMPSVIVRPVLRLRASRLGR